MGRRGRGPDSRSTGLPGEAPVWVRLFFVDGFFKEVGDHLGHRSPDTTRIYAKVNLSMLRQVAFDDLGGLA